MEFNRIELELSWLGFEVKLNLIEVDVFEIGLKSVELNLNWHVLN